MLKKDKLRYNEYYDMQSVFDELYQQSRNNNEQYERYSHSFHGASPNGKAV